MRTIDQNAVSKMTSGEFSAWMLLRIDIDGVVYGYTDSDIPIHHSGELYTPNAFDLDPVKYSTSTVVDLLNLRISDVENILKGSFVGGTPNGSSVTLKLYVDLDDRSESDQAAFPIFIGTIDGWNADESDLQIYVANDMTNWNQRPLNKHGASCRWKKFKVTDSGSPCMYAGDETWCDRSYSRCSAIRNTDNFGGFRWLPSLETKEIYWGHTFGQA